MSTGIGSNSFPDINIPLKEKDEEWHKRFVLAITSKAVDSSFDTVYRAIESCQDYYNGLQSSDAFNFLQQSVDGDSLPAVWINYNKVKPKVDLLLGEFSKKSYNINVYSVNKEAKARKLEEKTEAEAELKLSPYVANLERESGMSLAPNSPFENDEELEDFYNYSFKEKAEVVVKSSLEFSLERQRWSYERRSLFRDMIITGRCFVKCELINGIPKARRIDPKYVVFDRNSTDDFLTDSTFWGEVRYMSIAEAAQKYKVSEEDLKSAHNQWKNVGSQKQGNPFTLLNSTLGNSSMSFFSEEDGTLRVLVFEAYWVDYKKISYKESEDSYGNTHYKYISDETKENKNIKPNFCKIWRKGVLLGGVIIKDWGEAKNQPRSIDDPSSTGSPYKGVVVNYINKASQSVVSSLKPLQDLKNIAMYNLQLSMARAGAKGFVYDVAQVPEGWTPETVMKYLKSAGIAFIDSRQDDGLPAQFNQFTQIDLSLGGEVDKYISISRIIDEEMDQISGINEARQGIVQGSSQAVGVTQSALMQSSLTTEVYFASFQELSSDIFNYLAGLIKIAWPQYKDRFSPIIGDEGISFLEDYEDIDLNDYDVTIKEVPPSLANTESLHSLVHAALQNQEVSFVDALKMLKESDIDKGIRMLEKAVNKKQREDDAKEKQIRDEQAQQMQAQQEAQQQAEAEAQNSQREFDMQKINADIQSKDNLKDKDRENKNSEISAKLKADLILERVKNGFNLKLEKIKSSKQNQIIKK